MASTNNVSFNELLDLNTNPIQISYPTQETIQNSTNESNPASSQKEIENVSLKMLEEKILKKMEELIKPISGQLDEVSGKVAILTNRVSKLEDAFKSHGVFCIANPLPPNSTSSNAGRVIKLTPPKTSTVAGRVILTPPKTSTVPSGIPTLPTLSKQSNGAWFWTGEPTNIPHSTIQNANFNHLSSLINQKNYPKAMQYIEDSLSFFSPISNDFRVKMLIEKGRVIALSSTNLKTDAEEGLKTIREGLKCCRPQDKETKAHLHDVEAFFLIEQEKYEQALTAAKEGLDCLPENKETKAVLYLRNALIHNDGIKNRSKALSSAAEGLKLHPSMKTYVKLLIECVKVWKSENSAKETVLHKVDSQNPSQLTPSDVSENVAPLLNSLKTAVQQKDYKKALELVEKSLKLSSINQSNLISMFFSYQAIAFKELGQNLDSLLADLHCLEFSIDQISDKITEERSLVRSIDTLLDLKKGEEAKSMSLYGLDRKYETIETHAILCERASNAYNMLNNHRESIAIAQRGIDYKPCKNMETSLYFRLHIGHFLLNEYEKSVEIASKKVLPNVNSLSITYQLFFYCYLSNALNLLRRYNEAAEYALLGKQLDSKHSFQHLKARLCMEEVVALIHLEKYPEALKFVDEGISYQSTFRNDHQALISRKEFILSKLKDSTVAEKPCLSPTQEELNQDSDEFETATALSEFEEGLTSNILKGLSASSMPEENQKSDVVSGQKRHFSDDDRVGKRQKNEKNLSKS